MPEGSLTLGRATAPPIGVRTTVRTHAHTHHTRAYTHACMHAHCAYIYIYIYIYVYVYVCVCVCVHGCMHTLAPHTHSEREMYIYACIRTHVGADFSEPVACPVREDNDFGCSAGLVATPTELALQHAMQSSQVRSGLELSPSLSPQLPSSPTTSASRLFLSEPAGPGKPEIRSPPKLRPEAQVSLRSRRRHSEKT